MDPQVRYAHTSDGFNIAYWTLGEGGTPLLVTPPLIFSHIALEWQFPPLRQWYEALAAHRMIVRYDMRGMGSSQRDGMDDATLPTLCLDIDAVVGALNLERLALLSALTAWPLVVAYAAKEPIRVSHLVFGKPEGDFSTVQAPFDRAMDVMRDADWHTFTELWGRTQTDRQSGREATLLAGFVREATTAEVFRLASATTASGAWDVSYVLPRLKVPALIVSQGTDNQHHAVARSIAAALPNGRLLSTQGEPVAVYELLTGETLVAMNEFLGDVTSPRSYQPPRPPAGLPSGTAVILFVDIASSTALTEQMGDGAFRERSRALDAAIRAAVRECGGTAVEGKVMGDGVMSVFTAARDAIEAALRCRDASLRQELPLHLGVHAGDVLAEEKNVYGGAVNLAARVCDASAPGEIWVTDVVRALARTSANVQFDDRGEHELKGIADPMRLFAVVAR